MVEPVKIVDLATDYQASGLRVGAAIEILFTGVRRRDALRGAFAQRREHSRARQGMSAMRRSRTGEAWSGSMHPSPPQDRGAIRAAGRIAELVPEYTALGTNPGPTQRNGVGVVTPLATYRERERERLTVNVTAERVKLVAVHVNWHVLLLSRT